MIGDSGGVRGVGSREVLTRTSGLPGAMLDTLPRWATDPNVQLVAGLLAALVGSVAVYAAFGRLLATLTARSSLEFDDFVVRGVRIPAALTILAVGVGWASVRVLPPGTVAWAVSAGLTTLVVVSWARGLGGIAADGLGWLAKHREKYHTVVTPRSLPVFDIAARILIYGGMLYLVLVAWDVDVTGWLASAGIVGVVVGLASQDTLANFIAGLFILADAPYQLGEVLVLETGERGEVVDIGIRATRLRASDGVEIIVPNKMMANARIHNQSRGAPRGFSVSVPLMVAYGSDLDVVRDTVTDLAREVDGVLATPPPALRVKALGAVGIELDLTVIVARPALHATVVDALLTRTYDRFRALAEEASPPSGGPPAAAGIPPAAPAKSPPPYKVG
ncbi:MAG: mechanosensitive ion channel family protein [Myxococcota bacterium]